MISLTSVIVAIFALAVQIFSKSFRKPFGLSVFLKVICRSSQSCLNSLRMPSLQLHFTNCALLCTELMNYSRFAPVPFAPTRSRFTPTQSRFALTLKSFRSNFKVISSQLKVVSLVHPKFFSYDSEGNKWLTLTKQAPLRPFPILPTTCIIIEYSHGAHYAFLIYGRNQTNTFRFDGSLSRFNKKF